MHKKVAGKMMLQALFPTLIPSGMVDTINAVMRNQSLSSKHSALMKRPLHMHWSCLGVRYESWLENDITRPEFLN